MFDSSQWVLSSETFQAYFEKWQSLITLMADVYQAPAGFIVQYTNQGYQIVIANESALNPYPADASVISSDTNIFCRKVVSSNQTLYVNNATELSEWADNPEVSSDGFNSYLGMPLHWPDGSPFGTICVMDFAKTDYQEVYQRLMGQFRDFVEQDLTLMKQYRELEALSLKDSLTDLYNRRGFMLFAEKALQVARRYQKSVGLLFADLDDLKDVNDQQGHLAGDKLLEGFAERLQQRVRQTDVIARIGGDEFAALVVLDSEDELHQLVARIQSGSEDSVTDEPIAVSLGYRFYDHDQISALDQMLEEVDTLMYQNKRRRKNQH